MAKYKEIVSMVLDRLKMSSDDDFYTEEHIIFLAGRYRSFLIKQRYYSDIRKQIPESNYQTLCIPLKEGTDIAGEFCGGFHLESEVAVPALLPIGTMQAFPSKCQFCSQLTFISSERMKYVGGNKWTQNIIYATIGADNKIYLKSDNPQFKYLENVSIKGIFENAEEASELACENNEEESTKCDILEREFPIEDALVAPLIELITKELASSVAIPEDKDNDANDGISRVSS